MASPNCVIVHVDGASLGRLFSEMLTWLDAQKIERIDFRLTGGLSAGLNVSFSNMEEASLFAWKFDRPAPVTEVVRATPAEPATPSP